MFLVLIGHKLKKDHHALKSLDLEISAKSPSLWLEPLVGTYYLFKSFMKGKQNDATHQQISQRDLMFGILTIIGRVVRPASDSSPTLWSHTFLQQERNLVLVKNIWHLSFLIALKATKEIASVEEQHSIGDSSQ